MEKPIDLKIEEAKAEITNLINKINLPAFLLEPIIKELYNEIVVIKNKDLKDSKEKYEKSLRKEEKNGEN